MKDGRKEGRQAGRKEGRKEGRTERLKEGRKKVMGGRWEEWKEGWKVGDVGAGVRKARKEEWKEEEGLKGQTAGKKYKGMVRGPTAGTKYKGRTDMRLQ